MKLKEQKAKPVLRWAGGKLWMLSQIKNIMPRKFNDYHEPFVGGGSIFSNLDCKNRIFISDSNNELICFYNQVKNNFDGFLYHLQKFENTKEDFYKIRQSNPDSEDEIAARFYYLNRTCFNGLYRVNQNGLYNVPYGYRDISLIDLISLKNLQKSLQKVVVSCSDFEKSLKLVKKGDFVFIDPPYTVAHNKNGFIEYNQKIFSWHDQERLLNCTNELIEKNAYFIMTNAYHESIKSLYKNLGNHYEIERYSTISGNMNSRFKISLTVYSCIWIQKINLAIFPLI